MSIVVQFNCFSGNSEIGFRRILIITQRRSERRFKIALWCPTRTRGRTPREPSQKFWQPDLRSLSGIFCDSWLLICSSCHCIRLSLPKPLALWSSAICAHDHEFLKDHDSRRGTIWLLTHAAGSPCLDVFALFDVKVYPSRIDVCLWTCWPPILQT